LSYNLEFEDLPDAFDGFKITQISDIHSGSFDNQTKVQYGVDLVNQQKSDLVLFTGDLVNNRADEIKPWIKIFNKIKAEFGVFSILGNHDYGDYMRWESPAAKRKNMEDLYDAHNEMGWDLLLNESRFIEKDGERLAIMGVENSISIKLHRTPQTIRAYCELFIYIFPFYYAPTLIYNLGNAALGFEIGATAGGSEYFDTTFLVYALNVIISFILISLFNVQEQIENPFDGDGMDDIQLENYELEY